MFLCQIRARTRHFEDIDTENSHFSSTWGKTEPETVNELIKDVSEFKKLDGFSGADLASFVREAVRVFNPGEFDDAVFSRKPATVTPFAL